jgi:ketosteroid isomerase-like protein
VLAVVVAVPTSACAQRQDAKAEIAALEDSWIKAVIARDSAAFERLLHTDFIYTEDDRTYARAQLIHDMSTTTDTTTSGRNEELVVRLHGDVGVATGWLVLVGRSGGKAFERRYRYTDTWVRGGGRWRVLAAQDYLKP